MHLCCRKVNARRGYGFWHEFEAGTGDMTPHILNDKGLGYSNSLVLPGFAEREAVSCLQLAWTPLDCHKMFGCERCAPEKVSDVLFNQKWTGPPGVSTMDQIGTLHEATDATQMCFVVFSYCSAHQNSLAFFSSATCPVDAMKSDGGLADFIFLSSNRACQRDIFTRAGC